ncbi:type III pantothenate kinase [Hymenobacter chitinivorans]|uniref:Type III pantothenate kinase n=1 Tax=Hymenobacter chitinivorans DSM 11115 TaxID=1121954 RepID=A0A2M9ARN0_9BACT|nr:type III pantothenate kinase [Hymenobacter chitinivorans]PJJ48361.1 type III pantothenate kinase [Hymenobacter chitinivorans DSM 11115]
MRTLALDIGNTAVKYGCFAGNELLETGVVESVGAVSGLLQRLAPEHVISSSVAEDTTRWAAQWQQQISGRVLEFLPATTLLPIRNGYATPHTLGADRLAAAVGAAWFWPTRSTLIIDAGTAIKCDWVEGGHTFRGGSIAPGLRLRFQALHTFTGRLPLVTPPAELTVPLALTGDDTESAIRSGVLNGAVAEVNGFIAAYQDQNPDLQIVLAGGDAGFFQPRLKGRIFVIPELVLIGLHRILVHNVEI